MSRPLLAALLAFALPAFASTHHWFGTTSNRISDPANWSGGSPAGDPDAELVFDSDGVRREVYNDVPSLQFRSMSLDRRYTLYGEPLLAHQSRFFNAGTILCDIIVDGTLTIAGSFVISGSITGPGSVTIGGEVTYAGPRPNTYSGETVLRP